MPSTLCRSSMADSSNVASTNPIIHFAALASPLSV